jgi:hypothetical protein
MNVFLPMEAPYGPDCFTVRGVPGRGNFRAG